LRGYRIRDRLVVIELMSWKGSNNACEKGH
jgi:hypothetical protein